jgi:16S rRNA (adenine1518-N6/adenine1519-N6)-dimethyltransferase
MTASDQPSLSALFRKYQLRPDKSLGQNFLTDPGILKRIVEIAEIDSQDLILEIGAGLGHLTRQLAEKARQVIAVEIDQRLLPALEDSLGSIENIQIIQGDILQLDPGDLVGQQDYLVVANIPYYITSSILRNLLEAGTKPKRIILTLQYQVAHRICATSGKMSVLALSVLMYGEPYLTLRIPAGAFYPTPKVDSAVVRIDLYPEPILLGEAREDYFKLIKAGFQHKRKTLRNSLAAGLNWPKHKTQSLLSAARIDPNRRAESLSIPDWIELTHQYDMLIKE